MNYSKHDLQQLDTIEQAWDGSELKIEENNIRVWLTPPENRRYDGDYTIERRDMNGKWEQQLYMFDQSQHTTYIHVTIKIRYMPNMSYCRFENTYNDLIDCLDNISSEAGNERDERYRIRLIKLLADNMDLISDLKDIEPEYQQSQLTMYIHGINKNT